MLRLKKWKFYYPCIIDPAGMCFDFLILNRGNKKKHYIKINEIEFLTIKCSDSGTIYNIKYAMTTGNKVLIYEFDEKMLALLMPLIEYKKRNFLTNIEGLMDNTHEQKGKKKKNKEEIFIFNEHLEIHKDF